MRERTKGLIAGILMGASLFGITGTALAASGVINLDVVPVNIKVNNEIFQPKDVNGNDVMVFAYNGTTYAPLRALAEAYGLEVGWDQASGTATVIDPEKVVEDETPPITSAGAASAEDLERWAEGKVDDPSWLPLNLVKIDGKHYARGSDKDLTRFDACITYDNGTPLVFVPDIVVNDSGTGNFDENGNWVPITTCKSYDLLHFLRQALMTSYTIEETQNPYLDGIFVIETPEFDLSDVLQIGFEESKYISLTQKYTPMWIQYGDTRIYNAPEQNGFYVHDGMRYYYGNVCFNDVLAKLGIDKSFSITEYQDIYCIEWSK